MGLTPGARLGAYEVVEAIGAGGMGEVYRARDLKLGRDVALKILPDHFVGDPDRVARFEREAQVIASLNHPNIAMIYGFQDSDGVKALVLELVEGDPLSVLIARRPLPLDETVAIARQIADALEAAHDKGIVHRDLKPDNVKISPDGKIKVLDFGLAKMLEPEMAQNPTYMGTMSPTLSIHATYGGVILGTAAYMSPEQARGKPVDRRTDIWSFGCVLFEMLTGKQTFEPGETISDAVAHILTREPDWNALPADTPSHVRTLLRRCLQKDPHKRLPHIGLVRLELDEGAHTPAADQSRSTEPAPRDNRSAKGRVIAVGAIAAAIAIGAVATWALMRRPTESHRPVRFSVISSQPFVSNAFFNNLAISPDGTRFVYIAGAPGGEQQMMMRPLDQLEAVAMKGITSAGSPFFSPDSRSIGFFVPASSEMKRVSIDGGPAVTLARFQGTPRGASWGPDNTIVFATNDPTTGLLRIRAGGGEPTVLTKPDPARGEGEHYFPSFLPGGKAVLFTVTPANGVIENAQVAVLDLTTGQTKTLVGGTHARYVASGHLVYASGGSLRAVRFDLEHLTVVGDPLPVVDQVRTLGTGAALFDISDNGTLVFIPGGFNASVGAPRSLVWVDRHGVETAIPVPIRSYVFARISPDGQRAAVDIRDQENDIWIWDFKRQTLTKLTFNPGADAWPIWTPDGKHIVFASARGAFINLFWQPSDGTGMAERLTTSANSQNPHSFSPDGKTLIVQEVIGGNGADLTTLDMTPVLGKTPTGKLETQPLLHTPAQENAGEISPDGHWIAYYSNSTGRPEVYVRAFPNVDGGGQWLVSTNGGSRPAWNKNGRELFFLGLDGVMMSVPVQTTPTFTPGNPVKLFDGQQFAGGQSGRLYDVSADGQRFLMIKEGSEAGAKPPPPTLTVVVDWLAELKQRFPNR